MKGKFLSALCCIGIALGSTGTAHAAIFGDQGEPAWSRLAHFLTVQFGQTASDEVVLTLPQTQEAWSVQDPVLRLASENQWGDAVPSRAWQYSPDSNKHVSTGYSYFLQSAINAYVGTTGNNPPDVQLAIINLNNRVVAARNSYNAAVATANQAYLDYAAQTSIFTRKPKSQWLHEQGYDVEVNAAKGRLNSALQDFTLLSSSITDPDFQLLKDAQVKLSDPSSKISLPPTVDVRNDPGLWRQYYVSLMGGEPIDDFDSQNVVKLESISETDQESDYVNTHWQANASLSFLGLFPVASAGAQQSHTESDFKANTTRIDVSFANLGVFAINRGDWFNSDVISRFSRMLSQDRWNAVFGQNGSLEMIPKSVLVGRGMKIDIYADSRTVHELHDYFSASASAGFFIGYFRLGGSGNYSTTHDHVQVNDLGDHLEILDMSGTPQVLAVLAKCYDLDRPATFPNPAAIAATQPALPHPTNAQRANAMLAIQRNWTPSPAITNLKSNLSAQDKAAVFQSP